MTKTRAYSIVLHTEGSPAAATLVCNACVIP